MRYHKAVFAALILTCSSVEAMAQKTITGGPYFGCKDSTVGDRILSMKVQGDREAATKLLLASVISGQCKMWNAGDKAYIDSVGFARHCLRPAGDVECYWTPREAIQ